MTEFLNRGIPQEAWPRLHDGTPIEYRFPFVYDGITQVTRRGTGAGFYYSLTSQNDVRDARRRLSQRVRASICAEFYAVCARNNTRILTMSLDSLVIEDDVLDKLRIDYGAYTNISARMFTELVPRYDVVVMPNSVASLDLRLLRLAHETRTLIVLQRDVAFYGDRWRGMSFTLLRAPATLSPTRITTRSVTDNGYCEMGVGRTYLNYYPGVSTIWYGT